MSRRRLGIVLFTAAAVVAASFAVIRIGPASAATNVLIRGVASNRCLAPPASNLSNVTIQNCANQRWSTTDSGQITINGQCLDAKGEQTGNGTVVTIYACHGRANQRWTVNSDGTIRGAQSGRCLDVKGESTAAGALVQLYDCHGRGNQRWTLVGGNPGNPSPSPSSPEPSPSNPPADGDGPDMAGYATLYDYRFGTNAGRFSNLSSRFNPYGIAGTTVINNEWQRYQPINGTNHRLTGDKLELTALANLGGVYNGGISSGQITTKDTFYPRSGKKYIFKLRAKVPQNKRGAWPAFWMYARQAPNTSSEIDIFEIFDTPTQNTFDWTGYDHGAGVGSNFHSIMTNQWVWHPGFDFAAAYHTYTLVWEEGKIYKWVDDYWVKGTNFTWQGSDPQVLINLAMGGSSNNNPNSASFPAVFSIDSFQVFVDCPGAAVTTGCHTPTG